MGGGGGGGGGDDPVLDKETEEQEADMAAKMHAATEQRMAIIKSTGAPDWSGPSAFSLPGRASIPTTGVNK